MATAKRVPQDKKAVVVDGGPEYIQVTETFQVNGQTLSTKVLESYYRPSLKTVYVDQPDRVVLEMSLEEAHALIYFAMDDSTPHLKKDALAVANAVENARLSPPVGTQTSSAQDASCGKATDGYKTEGSSTYR